MIQVITIALWAHLFCGKWSETESVFGWLKERLYKRLPWYVFKPLIGCAMCHAVWVSAIFEAVSAHQYGFELENALSILCSSFCAILLDDFQAWREAKTNR